MTSLPVDRPKSEADQVLGDLIQQSLSMLLPVTVVTVWAWGLAVHFLHVYSLAATVAIVVTVVTAWLASSLAEDHLHLAVGIYLAGLLLTVTDIVAAYGSPTALYLYILVVVVTATLTNARVTCGVTLLSLAAMTGMTLTTSTMWPSDLAMPVVLVLLTALTSWVSSRRLFTALTWALHMSNVSQKNAAEARRRRAELRRALKSLDEAYVRLERANEALATAQKAAEKAYRFKAEFVANVSHELRTPLNLITGFASMMATAPESYGGKPLPREFRGDIMAIYRNARHLSDLIDDVLDLSRIETGSMPLVKERADLCQVAEEVIEMVKGLAEGRGLYLRLHTPARLPQLSLDRTRIRQVLLNLLTNATRFTDQGGIQVRIRRDDEQVVVTVEDTGRGISPDRIANAFEAFSQLEDGQARQGSGLGLAVSRKFVELHGGSMWIDSELDQGTAVGFSLPLASEGSGLAQPLRTSADSSLSHEPLVLLVHDDENLLTLLRRHVPGFQFVLAETAQQARRIIREELPFAVLVDAKRSDQHEAIDTELDLPAHMPILRCPLPSIRHLGVLMGAYDYLLKPVTQQDLSDALSRLPEPPQEVLLIDDNPEVVRLLARVLRLIHPEVRLLKAFDGERGLELARTEHPDLILLDLILPGMSGYDVLSTLARENGSLDSRVIIISARSVEEEIAPIPLDGQIGMKREMGFCLSEVLQIMRMLLTGISQSATTVPGDAEGSLAALPAPQAW